MGSRSPGRGLRSCTVRSSSGWVASWEGGAMVEGEVAGAARRGRPGHDQQAVLRVAVDLFNRQGYDATSVGDVARELGLTKSAIYHHVPSKEHLLQSAIDEALDALTAALDEVSASAGLGAGE